MNWKLLMLTLGQMPVYLAPVDVDDEGGGDNDDIDDPENQDDDDEEADDDEDDDDDEEADDDDPENQDDDEGDDDDPENQDDDEGDDDDDDEGDKDLGKGAQKRIRQLVEQKNTAQSRVKDLEKQLEEAKKLSGDDGRALLAAAEATGILPGLMTKDEAKAFQDIAEIPSVIERYQDWLDDADREDEFELGNGKTMSYGDVKKRVRKLRAQLDDLKDRYGDRRKKTRKRFPGYLLIRMDLYDESGRINERVWHQVRSVQGMLGFLGGENHPEPLSPEEVADIMRPATGGESDIKPKITFSIGEVVRIKDGAFENFEGAINEIDAERGKLKLMVSIFGRSTPVELEFWQVERVV